MNPCVASGYTYIRRVFFLDFGDWYYHQHVKGHEMADVTVSIPPSEGIVCYWLWWHEECPYCLESWMSLVRVMTFFGFSCGLGNDLELGTSCDSSRIEERDCNQHETCTECLADWPAHDSHLRVSSVIIRCTWDGRFTVLSPPVTRSFLWSSSDPKLVIFI